MDLDLHPYDGVDQHYRHTDAYPAKGLAIVTYILGFTKTPSSDGLLYDLSFYSGGIGVLDSLAITIPADAVIWAEASADAREPEDIAKDEEWAEEFLWLIRSDDDSSPVRARAVKFVNSERKPFQEECTTESRLLFHRNSNVNDWSVCWGSEAQLNFLGYSQG